MKTWIYLHGVEKKYHSSSPSMFKMDMEICEGDLVWIQGKNGAGKSTLLRLIAGIEKPNAGRIVYTDDIKKHISYLPQELSLYEELSVYENLKFWGIAAGMRHKPMEERIRRLLEDLRLSEKKHEKVKNLSGGMKRRLHFATAIIKVPKILLLDEPFVASDTESVDMMLHMLEELHKEKVTIVWINHQDEIIRGEWYEKSICYHL